MKKDYTMFDKHEFFPEYKILYGKLKVMRSERRSMSHQMGFLQKVFFKKFKENLPAAYKALTQQNLPSKLF